MTLIGKLGENIARIFDQSGNIVGVGFLAAENSIVTCSHIISHLNQSNKQTPLAFDNEIIVDFPLARSKQQLQTRLIYNSLIEDQHSV